MTDETNPPTEQPSKEHAILLGGMRAVLQEELRKTEQKLADRIGLVEVGVNTLRSDLVSLESRVDDVERRLEEKVSEAVAVHSRSNRSLMLGLESNPNIQSSRDSRYWKARRSLRLWPVPGEGEQKKTNLLRFLANKLRLGEDVLADADAEDVI